MRSGAVVPLEQAPRGGCIPLDPLAGAGPPTASGVRLAVKQRRRVLNQSVGEANALPTRDPPRWSVAEVVDAAVCPSFLLYDKRPPAPPASRRGPCAHGLGSILRRQRCKRLLLALRRAGGAPVGRTQFLTYPALQKGGAWCLRSLRWSAAGSRLEPAGVTTGYGPACRAAWRLGAATRGSDPQARTATQCRRPGLLMGRALQARRTALPGVGAGPRTRPRPVAAPAPRREACTKRLRRR